MIYINSISWAVQTVISSHQTVVDSNISVDLYRNINTDYGRAPWIGVNRATVAIEPHRSNITEPWQAQIAIPLIIQITNRDKQAGLIALDKLTTIVMTAVNCNRTLMLSVDNVMGWNISPFEEEELEDMFFMNQIDIQAEFML